MSTPLSPVSGGASAADRYLIDPHSSASASASSPAPPTTEEITPAAPSSTFTDIAADQTQPPQEHVSARRRATTSIQQPPEPTQPLQPIRGTNRFSLPASPSISIREDSPPSTTPSVHISPANGPVQTSIVFSEQFIDNATPLDNPLASQPQSKRTTQVLQPRNLSQANTEQNHYTTSPIQQVDTFIGISTSPTQQAGAQATHAAADDDITNNTASSSSRPTSSSQKHKIPAPISPPTRASPLTRSAFPPPASQDPSTSTVIPDILPAQTNHQTGNNQTHDTVETVVRINEPLLPPQPTDPLHPQTVEMDSPVPQSVHTAPSSSNDTDPEESNTDAPLLGRKVSLRAETQTNASSTTSSVHVTNEQPTKKVLSDKKKHSHVLKSSDSSSSDSLEHVGENSKSKLLQDKEAEPVNGTIASPPAMHKLIVTTHDGHDKNQIVLASTKSRKSPTSHPTLESPHANGDGYGNGAQESEFVDEEEEIPKDLFPPQSKFLVYWSYLILFISIYNITTIPYRFGFWSDPVDMTGDVIFLLVLDYLGDLCYIFGMYISLHTAYVDNGIIVWDRKKIRERYLKSWFVVDFCTSIPFDLLQIIYGRIVPFVRLPKVLRLAQVYHHFDFLEKNSSANVLFRLFKLLLYTFFISHYFGCISYVILRNDERVDVYAVSQTKSAFSMYLQQLYFGMGTLTSRDDSEPPNTVAYAYLNVIVMFTGVLWCAYIVAALEEFAASGDSIHHDFQARVGSSNQFSRQFNLPPTLQDSIKSYYNYVWASSEKYDREALSRLPTCLHNDLRLAICYDILSAAAIFEHAETGFLSFIVGSMETIVAMPGEIIAAAGTPGTEMFFIEDGEVEIVLPPLHTKVATLRKNDYFGEYALLLPTQPHRSATSRAIGFCTLWVLPQQTMLDGLQLYPYTAKFLHNLVFHHRERTKQQDTNMANLTNGTNNNKASTGKKLHRLIHLESVTQEAKSTSWTISPNSKAYTAWMILVGLFALWNAIVVPMRWSFLLHWKDPSVLVIDYLGDFVFFVDILVSFRLRYHSKGEEVKDIALLKTHYLQGWFWWDVVASLPLDLIMLYTGIDALLRVNKMIRIAHTHVSVYQAIKDKAWFDLVSLVHLCVLYFYISHVFACIYYAFPRFEGYGEDFQAYGPNKILEEGSIFWQYMWSQYYSISFLAGLGYHTGPKTDADVMLVLIIALAGTFLDAFLIGKLGELFFSLNAAAASEQADILTVIPVLESRTQNFSHLVQRLNDYTVHSFRTQRGTDPNAVLAALPTQLRSDIMMHVCGKILLKIPFIGSVKDPEFVKILASELTILDLPAQEVLYYQGYVGASLYLLASGIVEVTKEPETEYAQPTTPAYSIKAREPSKSHIVMLGDHEDHPASPDHKGHQSTNQRLSPTAHSPAGASQAWALTHTGSSATLFENTQTFGFRTAGAGEYFGQESMFSPIRRETVRTKTACQIFKLSEESFRKVLKRFEHSEDAKRLLAFSDDRLKDHPSYHSLHSLKKAEDTTTPHHKKPGLSLADRMMSNWRNVRGVRIQTSLEMKEMEPKTPGSAMHSRIRRPSQAGLPSRRPSVAQPIHHEAASARDDSGTSSNNTHDPQTASTRQVMMSSVVQMALRSQNNLLQVPDLLTSNNNNSSPSNPPVGHTHTASISNNSTVMTQSESDVKPPGVVNESI